MIDLAGIGQVLTGGAALASVVMATRASGHARRARVDAGAARDAALTVARNLDQHYARVEASYEASREATLSLLAYMQGQTSATQRFARDMGRRDQLRGDDE